MFCTAEIQQGRSSQIWHWIARPAQNSDNLSQNGKWGTFWIDTTGVFNVAFQRGASRKIYHQAVSQYKELSNQADADVSKQDINRLYLKMSDQDRTKIK